MGLKRPTDIKLVGIFAITLGGWILLRDIRPLYYLLLNLSQIVGDFGLSTVVFGVFYLFVLSICFIFGGIAFLLLKRWGRILVLISLVVDLLIRLVFIVHFWYASFTVKQTILIPEGAYMGTYSMIPTYITFLAETVALYFTTRPKIKKLFLQKS